MAATKYTLTLESGFTAEYSRKDAAVKAGEKSGTPYTVSTAAGNVVHEVAGVEAPTHVITEDGIEELPEEDLLGTLEPAAEEAEEVAPEEAPEPAEAPEEDVEEDERYSHTVNFRDHGPKHFWKALGRTVVDVYEDDQDVVVSFNNRDFSVTIHADEAEVATARAAEVTDAWDEAMTALKGFKKTETYVGANKKTSEGRAYAYELEQGFLSRYITDKLGA